MGWVCDDVGGNVGGGVGDWVPFYTMPDFLSCHQAASSKWYTINDWIKLQILLLIVIMAERSVAKKIEYAFYAVDALGILATGIITALAPYHSAAVAAALMGGVTGHFVGKGAEKFRGKKGE